MMLFVAIVIVGTLTLWIGAFAWLLFMAYRIPN